MNCFYSDISRFFHTFAPSSKLLGMKKASLIFMMCIFVLGMHARQQQKINLEQIVFCESHPGSWQDRHRAPGKKSLQVYYDGEFVYLQNAFVGGAYLIFG